MKKDKKMPKPLSMRRFIVTLAALLIVFIGMVHVCAYIMPYDRVEWIFGIRGVKSFEAGCGEQQVEIVFSGEYITRPHEMELLINGKPAGKYHVNPYAVVLNATLDASWFEKPGALKISVIDHVLPLLPFRSKPVTYYVTEPAERTEQEGNGNG